MEGYHCPPAFSGVRGLGKGPRLPPGPTPTSCLFQTKRTDRQTELPQTVTRRLLPWGWRRPSCNDLSLETIPRGSRPFKSAVFPFFF